MAYLFTIVMFISLVVFAIFGIKSLLAIFKKQDNKKSFKISLYSFSVAVFALGGVAVTAPDVENSKEVPVSSIVGDIEKVESDNANINNELTVDAYTQQISKVFKEMGSKTNLKIVSILEQEDGSTNIRLSKDTIINASINGDIINQLSLHMNPEAFYDANNDFKFAFILLIGTADNTLSMGNRNLIYRELGLDDKKVFKNKYNSDTKVGVITYSYEGNDKSGYTLTAKW